MEESTDGDDPQDAGPAQQAGTGDGRPAAPLSPELLRKMDAYWRAANYLSVGQIYLYDNPLLREPLKLEHVKPRLLGHWGTTPGQNFIYVHLNRIIKEYDLNMIYISGPGHGGPALVANTYLEGTYSELYPNISRGRGGAEAALQAVLVSRAASPATSRPRRPGSIHEGGELGYSLSHAFGAVFDNPDLIVACVVGDGEAETGPLATSWHSQQVPQPGARRGGAADPPPERLQDRQPDRPGPHRPRGARAAAARLRLYARTSSRGTTPRRCTRSWRRRSTRSSPRSGGSSPTPATGASPRGRAGR